MENIEEMVEVMERWDRVEGIEQATMCEENKIALSVATSVQVGTSLEFMKTRLSQEVPPVFPVDTTFDGLSLRATPGTASFTDKPAGREHSFASKTGRSNDSEHDSKCPPRESSDVPDAIFIDSTESPQYLLPNSMVQDNEWTVCDAEYH